MFFPTTSIAPLLLPDDAPMGRQGPVELQPRQLGIIDDRLEDHAEIRLGRLHELRDPFRLPKRRTIRVRQAVVMRDGAGERIESRRALDERPVGVRLAGRNRSVSKSKKSAVS